MSGALAITLAIVASLETLLSLEAVEQIDPKKRAAHPDRELKAQGIGNMMAGAIGASADHVGHRAQFRERSRGRAEPLVGVRARRAAARERVRARRA